MSQVSDSVRAFLEAHVPSIPHLELLLLLWRERRAFAAEEIARRIYVSPARARLLVEHFLEAGMLVGDGAEAGFRMRLADAELLPLLEQLDRTYARHVRAVAEIVHGGAQVRSSL